MDQMQDTAVVVGPELIDQGLKHLADGRKRFVGQTFFLHTGLISVKVRLKKDTRGSGPHIPPGLRPPCAGRGRARDNGYGRPTEKQAAGSMTASRDPLHRCDGAGIETVLPEVKTNPCQTGLSKPEIKEYMPRAVASHGFPLT
ncbi:hypothetical protein DSCA_63310 [Desulfosarcina alkanivorans]|uniref:Uncharacterized protein n=1 Tax=Desulfosarcina alkanivorans TaxID=571177 RepID=A0A5K7YYZ2_9BACT|nr:hypothetical protein DSCA_63310 [Desulfosarcina alkanivorans]